MEAPVVTVFRSRLDEQVRDDYATTSRHIESLARGMPGLVDAKTFTAPDGERVTIVTFADRASHDAWRDHPEHREAIRRGYAEFYTELRIQVATVEYERSYRR
ncbi:MAG: antibiotic biosynthesis monooxygenase [Deltaproteobacteria bacterium]